MQLHMSLAGSIFRLLPRQVRHKVRSRADRLRFAYWRLLDGGEPVLDRPVFVIGCPRSGTTLLTELLSAHPRLANYSEAGHIWDPKEFWNPDADHCWEEDRLRASEAVRLRRWFGHYVRRAGKERLLNKHPRNSVRIGYIRGAFPDAFFIHLIRDGRAVAHSIASRSLDESYRRSIPFGDFCKPPGWRTLVRSDAWEQAALQWMAIVRYVLAWRERLGARYHEIRYEELCRHPQQTLQEAFRACELPPDEAPSVSDGLKLKDANLRYRRELDPATIGKMESIQGELLRELGYLS